MELSWIVCNAISGLDLLLDIKRENDPSKRKGLQQAWTKLEFLKPAVLEYIQHVVDYGPIYEIQRPQLHKAIEAIEADCIAEISEELLSDLRDKAERWRADYLDDLERTLRQGPIRFAIA